jgi:diacylglycerol kinase family enzyme
VLEIGRDGSARSLARQAVQCRTRCVLVAGGDGTLHPWVAEIDLLRIGDRRVATVGGFGLAAHIAHQCNELRARALIRRTFAPLGRSIYSLCAAGRIITRGAMPMTYSLRANHGHPQTMVASALLVGLVSKFGGGLKLVPDGSIRPGTFFALVITAKTRSSLLKTLRRLRAGRTDGLRARTFSDLTSLSIRATGLVGAFGDGEWLGMQHRALTEIEPASLRVLVSSAFAPAAAHELGLREAI